MAPQGSLRYTQSSRILTKAKEGLECHWTASARLTIKVCPSCAPEMKAQLLPRGQEARGLPAWCSASCCPWNSLLHPFPLSLLALTRPPRNSHRRDARLQKQKFQGSQFPSILHCNNREVLDILQVYSEVTGKYITPIA